MHDSRQPERCRQRHRSVGGANPRNRPQCGATPLLDRRIRDDDHGRAGTQNEQGRDAGERQEMGIEEGQGGRLYIDRCGCPA